MEKNNPIQQKQVCIVVPVYNESDVVRKFHDLLIKQITNLPYQFSVIYVNDGSIDVTQTLLADLADSDERIRVIELSRNFGHQAALTAGLDAASGDYIITMDGDGQHPPQVISQMLGLAESGYDIVLTQRIDQTDVSPFKRFTSDIFYRLINRAGNTSIIPGGADFRLMTAAAVSALKQMPEYHRFLRGMVAWMGFKSVILPFEPAVRIGGSSKYSLKKMLRLALDAVFSFSLVPLYVGISIGVLFLVLALLEAVYVLSFWVSGRTEMLAPGWSSLMFMLLVVGGSLMVTVGVVGVYIGYIFQEVKRRPQYLVRTRIPGGEADD